MRLQTAGRIALAQSVAAQPIHIAWGRGDGQWTQAPGEPDNATALTDEFGRRLVTQIGYVTPASADDYDIAMPGGDYYKRSADPTCWLYLNCQFDFSDGLNETIREVGVFVGGTAKTSVPPGQRYLTPEQIETPGQLYCLAYRAPLIRVGTLKAIEEIILPF